MDRDHPYEIAVVYGASANNNKSKKDLLKYGVCRFTAEGLACLAKQDFPLAGATYSVARSKGALKTFTCTAGCRGVPSAIHDMGYENMEGQKNPARDVEFKKFRKACGAD